MRPRLGSFRFFRSVALIASAALLCGFTYEWESKGPFNVSGAIRHILVDPMDAHRIYAASENGGLWVLDDDRRYPEKAWRPLTDDLENLQMRGIAKSSFDPGYIVTANAAGFVYHSKNHGRTWSKIRNYNFQYIRRILIDEQVTEIPGFERVKDTRLWIACRLGLFRITLRNDAFVRIDQLYPQRPGQEPDVLDAVRNPLNGDLYVGVRGQGVWKRRGSPTNPANAWILSAAWTTFPDAESAMIKLAIVPLPFRIVAKFGRNVIMNDAQGDPTAWMLASPVHFGTDPGGGDIGYRGNYSTMEGEWTHALAISPKNRDVIATGQFGLFISSTGGQPGAGGAGAWAGVSVGHEDMQSLAFSPDGASLFVANDGGVFLVPVPLGTPLTHLNVNLTTAQFYRVGLNGKVAVGNADHQGLFGTRDIDASPAVWEKIATTHGFGGTGLENDFVSADPKTPGRFFVQFKSVHLLRLKFPGPVVPPEHLLPLNDPTTPLKPYSMTSSGTFAGLNVYNQLNYPVGTIAVDPRAGTNIMLAAVHVNLDTTFAIAKTLNADADPTGGPNTGCPAPAPVGGCFQTPVLGTASFTPVLDPPVAIPIVSITFSVSEPGKAYALDEAGNVFVLANVDDPAARFQRSGGFIATPPDFARQIVADPRTPGRVFALTHRQIQLSTDGNAAKWNAIGRSWLGRGSFLADPGPQLNALCLHPSNSNILYVATATGVLVSTNGGSTWKSIGEGLPNVAVMNVFTSPTHLYAVTFGRGLWRAKLPA